MTSNTSPSWQADLDTLAAHLKTRITRTPFSASAAGRIQRGTSQAAQWVVSLNENDTIEVQRATTAHLLGYIMWAADHLQDDVEFDRSYKSSAFICARSAREAFKFAKTHLLPEPALRTAFRTISIDATVLARDFVVPKDMVDARLHELNLVS